MEVQHRKNFAIPVAVIWNAIMRLATSGDPTMRSVNINCPEVLAVYLQG